MYLNSKCLRQNTPSFRVYSRKKWLKIGKTKVGKKIEHHVPNHMIRPEKKYSPNLAKKKKKKKISPQKKSRFIHEIIGILVDSDINQENTKIRVHSYSFLHNFSSLHFIVYCLLFLYCSNQASNHPKMASVDWTKTPRNS